MSTAAEALPATINALASKAFRNHLFFCTIVSYPIVFIGSA
ncbi:hypothetical protein [Gibbsiella dentisursi]